VFYNKFMTLKINRFRPNGFTLAEILITVTLLVIIGLAALIGINPLLQIFKGYDARRKADLYALKQAFESYYADKDCYPPIDILNNCGGNQLEPYLRSIPCDPQDNVPYVLNLIPSDSACAQQFAIYAKLLTPGDAMANLAECPQTMAVTSPGMSHVDIVNACSGKTPLCPVYYGCRNQICQVIAYDIAPTCQFYSCNSDCNNWDCGRAIRGGFFNDCPLVP
jgi:prepilin-type N-terminal cleavage/methylation domain-containing protein